MLVLKRTLVLVVTMALIYWLLILEMALQQVIVTMRRGMKEKVEILIVNYLVMMHALRKFI
jgi:hypothetical protein